MSYRDDPTYKVLEELINSAGIKIIYTEVPDDSIDGAIWARSDIDGNMIMMPDADEFSSDEQACAILGHEMGHLLTGLNSPDNVLKRVENEAVCDLAGVYLTKFAEMIAGKRAEDEFIKAFEGTE